MVRLPYGSSTIEFSIDADDFADDVHVEIIECCALSVREDCDALLREAIEHPLKTRRLREIVAEKLGSDAPGSAIDGRRGDIVIVVDDHTRDAPTENMLDALIDEIRDERIDRVKVLVACGTHDAPREDDLRRMLGKHYGRFGVRVHDCDDADSLVYLGETSRGTPVFINSTYLNAAVRVLTGDITLHYYAGFGGGRKSILPGISGRETIKRNHALLTDENARTGNLKGNPVHEDMCEVAAMAYPDFVLNVVSDAAGRVVAAFAGDMNEVFMRGVSVASEIFMREIGIYDMLIVSAGGFPKDRNFYQAEKAIEHCHHAVSTGGTLILVAECRDGIGDAVFEAWMNAYPSYESVENAVRTNFVLGGHKAYYLRKTMRRIRVCIVSSLDAERWGIPSYKSIQDAIMEEIPRLIRKREHAEIERGEASKAAKIGVVKNGMDVLLHALERGVTSPP